MRVGGSASPHSDSKTWSTELRNATTYNTWDRHHSVALTLDATLDGYSVQQDAGFGTFAFNSLNDFANGTPTSFSRTLTSLHTSGTGMTGAIGLGDVFNTNAAAPGFIGTGAPPPGRPTFQYGVRVEGNHFGFQPAYNAKVDSIFGVRTDHVPDGVRVMPMIGFTWPLFPVFKVNGLSFGRRGNISGGVREYRGTLSTRSIDSYTRQTGLPSAIQQLYCIGAAAPPPDWEGYQHGESIPTDCANGAASTPLAQTTPPVALFAPDYSLYDSWRPAFNVNYMLNTLFRRLGERHVGDQPERSGQLRSQLQPGDALQPRERRQSAHLRLADEHRAGDGRRDVRRLACVVRLRARDRGEFGSA